MIPVMTSFLPPTHVHLYLPALFKLWEAFNSAIVDESMLLLAGELSEEHVAGTAGDEGGAQWKDVGIWTQEEWTVLIGKALGSMSTLSRLRHDVLSMLTNSTSRCPSGKCQGMQYSVTPCLPSRLI